MEMQARYPSVHGTRVPDAQAYGHLRQVATIP
jgi:hypothetical protein